MTMEQLRSFITLHMCNTRHSLDHELLCAVGIYKLYLECGGFPGGSDSKESACSVGDPGLIPQSGKSSGEGNGYPCWYSCLENSMDRGAWRATVHGVAKSWIQLRD